MTKDDSTDAPARVGLHESRRWAIGIAITMFFGIFSAVMAYLSYAARTAPSAPAARTAPAAVAPTAAPASSEPDRGHGNHRNR